MPKTIIMAVILDGRSVAVYRASPTHMDLLGLELVASSPNLEDALTIIKAAALESQDQLPPQ